MGLQKTSADPWTLILCRCARVPVDSRRFHSHLLLWTENTPLPCRAVVEQEHNRVLAALTGSEQNSTASCVTTSLSNHQIYDEITVQENRAYPKPTEVIIKMNTAKTEFGLFLFGFGGVFTLQPL